LPAIQPARLRQQAVLLSQHFDQPAAFVRNLQYVLEFYAERIRRHGLKGSPAAMLPAYQVPQPVLRYLLQELTPLAEQDPPAGLALCDELWEREMLEFRQLACMLLGSIPVSAPSLVLRRIRSWVDHEPENILLDAIFKSGLVYLRRHHPQEVLDLAESWLNGSQPLEKQLGLRVLSSVIQEPDFDNLPVLFRMIHPLCQASPAAVRPDVLDLLESLARRSPQETAHFLRQTLNLPDSPQTPWLVRQVLHAFPEEIQKSLRQTLRSLESTGLALKE
jgi:hypothetical protein